MTLIPPVAPSERFPGRPTGGRVVVIAPTRAACETIELAIALTRIETVLERDFGDRIRTLARSGAGFGIVAGTGTGKTLGIRLIAEEVVPMPLRVGVVNREREATPETPQQNVVIVTTGIARRWLQAEMITAEDTIVVDEIHQTSAELELCLALAKRAGCRFIWLSATVDPAFYAKYLRSTDVIHASAVDPTKAAKVRVIPTEDVLAFLDDRFLRRVKQQQRGVAVFVPTRAESEAVAGTVEAGWGEAIHTTYYHGGEPISVLRPYLESEPPRPYVLSMTAAGQSALNVRGLDTVIILDAQFTSIVERGRSVLTRLPLGSNEILQMAGRVHGRVAGSEVWILAERDIHFVELRPEPPRFQLAGDPEQVALACARAGVRADDLELPVPLDRVGYRRVVANLERRGIVENGYLTDYGKQVEVLPVDRPWAELLVHAPEGLAAVVAVASAADSLHRMLRPDAKLKELAIPGSDHLTTYAIYADALERCGSIGQVHGLPRHVFDPDALAAWSEERGVQPRSVEDTALALASVMRALDLPLPRTLPELGSSRIRQWQELVARVMPFDLVMDGETSWGQAITPSQSSLCGSWGAIAGQIRYFMDKRGRARGSVEGTELGWNLVRRSAERAESEVVFDPSQPRHPLRLHQALVYHGFVLDREEIAIGRLPEELAGRARRVLAEAMAAGVAYHRSMRTNRGVIHELREVHRRSGGRTAAADEARLADWFAERLGGVQSYEEFLDTDLTLEADAWVPTSERERWLALPETVVIGEREYPVDYALDEGAAVARVRIPGEVVRRLDEEDLPRLDRPLHLTVLRGKRGSFRARSLAEAKERLAAPYETGESTRPKRYDPLDPDSPERRVGQRRASRERRRSTGTDERAARDYRPRRGAEGPGPDEQRPTNEESRQGPRRGRGDRRRGLREKLGDPDDRGPRSGPGSGPRAGPRRGRPRGGSPRPPRGRR